MIRRGFTIVELIIVITIMGILLTLAVVNVNSTQMNARDDERKADVESIAVNLESYYQTAIDGINSDTHYPTTELTGNDATITSQLRDASLKSFLPPGITDTSVSFLPSTNTGTAPNIQTTSGVLPQPTKNQYIYQPIKSDGSLCVSGEIDCRKFNLFYRLESDNTVYRITSKRQ